MTDSNGTLTLTEKVDSRDLSLPGRLRVSEVVELGFLSYTSVTSLLFLHSPREQLLVNGLNLLAGAVIILTGRARHPSLVLTTIRDWFPAILILFAYRESGLFLRADPTHHLDYLFQRLDRLLLHNTLIAGVSSFGAPWIQRYLELSYLLCYPLVPQGLGVLYLARPLVATPSAHRGLAAVRVNGFGAVVDQFWTTVLLAALSCYVIYPFFPLTPPRVLFHDLPGPAVEPLLRKINFWILDRYSVQACIFPSGHVAAVTATALAVRAYLPRLGVVFLTAATSIAIATVYGRYHYTADAMAGALVAIAAFWTSRRICVR